MPMCSNCHSQRDKQRAQAELEEYRRWKHRHKSTVKGLDDAFAAIEFKLRNPRHLWAEYDEKVGA